MSCFSHISSEDKLSAIAGIATFADATVNFIYFAKNYFFATFG